MYTSWLWEKLHHILDINSKHIEPPEELYSRPTKYFHLADTVTEFSKGIPPFYQASCFRMVRTMVRPVNFMMMDPLLQFIYSEVASLIKSNDVWNTMIVHKAPSSTHLTVFAEALHAGKANPYTECLF